MKIRAEPKYKTIQIRAEPQGSFLFPLNECTTFSGAIVTIKEKLRRRKKEGDYMACKGNGSKKGKGGKKGKGK